MLQFLLYAWDLLVKGGAAAVGFVRGLGGGENRVMTLLLVLMVADYVSGVVAGALRKSPKTEGGGLSSVIGWKGLLRKALMLLVIVLGSVLDRFVGENSAMFRNAVTWFYVSNEAISLLENLGHCGVPIPHKLRRMLEQLREPNDAVDAPQAERTSAPETDAMLQEPPNRAKRVPSQEPPSRMQHAPSATVRPLSGAPQALADRMSEAPAKAPLQSAPQASLQSTQSPQSAAQASLQSTQSPQSAAQASLQSAQSAAQASLPSAAQMPPTEAAASESREESDGKPAETIRGRRAGLGAPKQPSEPAPLDTAELREVFARRQTLRRIHRDERR